MNPILSYTGNAGLGLGSNPNIPVSASPNTLDILGQTSRDLANWNNQQNAMLYQQKVQDRDTLLKMLADDQISTKDVLPEYMPEIEKAIQEVDDVFMNDFKGNLNNTEGYRKYKQANEKALALAKLGQANTAQIKMNRAEKAREPISYRQADHDKFEKQELSKGLDDLVNPYQKVSYLDLNEMGDDLRQTAYFAPGAEVPDDTTQKTVVTDKGGKITTQHTTTTKPASVPRGKQPLPVTLGADGLPSIVSKQPDKIVNYDNILGMAGARFLERGKWAEQQEKLIEAVQAQPSGRSREFIDGINEKIRLYNMQTAGRATPVTELKENVDFAEVVDPQTSQKKLMISADTPEFAAKVALAQNPGNYFEAGAETFNKEAAEYGLKNAESKAKIGALNALSAQRRAAAALTGKKIKAADEQMNPVKLWDEISQGHIENQPVGPGRYMPRINASTMTESLKEAIGIDPINSSGDFNVIPAKVVLTMSDGSKKTLSSDETFKVYEGWLKNDPKAQELQDANGGKTPSVFDFLYTRPNVKYEMEIVGKTKPKKDKNGVVIDEGGAVTRSNAIQTWLNQQMNTGRKGDKVDLELEKENSSEE